MKAKQLLKKLYDLSHDVIWEIEANREIEGKSFIKPSDLERITELIDNISNDVEKAISQTREETIRKIKREVKKYILSKKKILHFNRIIAGEEILDILNKLKN